MLSECLDMLSWTQSSERCSNTVLNLIHPLLCPTCFPLPVALMSASVTSIKRLKEYYSQYLKPQTWHALWYNCVVKHISTIFPGRVYKGWHSFAKCVHARARVCVCVCVLFCVHASVQGRETEREREYDDERSKVKDPTWSQVSILAANDAVVRGFNMSPIYVHTLMNLIICVGKYEDGDDMAANVHHFLCSRRDKSLICGWKFTPLCI